MTIAHAALAIRASPVVMILIMVTMIWWKLRFSCHRLRRTQTSAATRETMLVQHLYVGLLKPHARSLQSLMAAASAAAQETVFIGDRADRDGGAGQRAGVRILIRSSQSIETPSRRFTIHCSIHSCMSIADARLRMETPTCAEMQV
jgi:hypothetical protein